RGRPRQRPDLLQKAVWTLPRGRGGSTSARGEVGLTSLIRNKPAVGLLPGGRRSGPSCGPPPSPRPPLRCRPPGPGRAHGLGSPPGPPSPAAGSGDGGIGGIGGWGGDGPPAGAGRGSECP